MYKDKKTNVKWWLHSKSRGKTTFYFFSKEQEDSLQDIPGGYEVTFNERSGIPLLRKISKRREREKFEKEGSK